MGSIWSRVPKIKGEIINAEAIETKLLPYNYEAILKDADLSIDESSSNEKLFDQLYAGVFLNQKREKYWIDKKSHKNNFMLFARNFSIAWIDDSNMWMWKQLKETSDVFIDVAELLNVCWLDINGKFDTSKLSPGTLYEVVFVVMLRIISYGWEFPVNLRLVFPDGTRQEKKENLMEKQREKWIEIHAGEFMVEKEMVGFVEFSLSETKILIWKRGLVVKGVVIRPKFS